MNISSFKLFLLSLAVAVPLTRADTYGDCFENGDELRAAVDAYLADPSANTAVAQKYGWPIGNWCVSAVQDFSHLFNSARNEAAKFFNEDLSGWCTCSATNMKYMFAGAENFNGDISGFVLNEVTNIQGMFESAFKFNQDISHWDVRNVVDFGWSFNAAYEFNQDLSEWCTESGTNFHSMFYSAELFNADISCWDVRNGEHFQMFLSDSSFNQDLCSWGPQIGDRANPSDFKFMFIRTECPFEEDDVDPTGGFPTLCYECGITSAMNPLCDMNAAQTFGTDSPNCRAPPPVPGCCFAPAEVTPDPTPAPTPRPTPNPTRPPSPRPTPNPTRPPTPAPSPRPTPNPTRPPSPRPTPNPTRAPTFPPFAEPAPECATAFVYCPGRSTCIQSSSFNNGQGVAQYGDFSAAWSIYYNQADGVVDNCEIWLGANCDRTVGTQVGTALITPTFFHYCLDLFDFEADTFQLYAGSCPANDAGMHFENGGLCSESAISQYALAVSHYPLVHQGEYTFGYTFSQDNQSQEANTAVWDSGYNVFPLGGPERDYITAHVDVCPYVAPEPVPTPAPTPAPTPIPFFPDEAGCTTAFVYCPGRSTCIQAPNFNNGVAVDQYTDESPAAWSISYSASTDNVVDTCEIWLGANCDRTEGTKIGTAVIAPNLFHYCLDLNDWEANKFQLYAGTCVANVGSVGALGSSCEPMTIGNYALAVDTYPLVYEGAFSSGHTFVQGDTSTDSDWASYEVFPLGDNIFLTAHVDLCPNGA